MGVAQEFLCAAQEWVGPESGTSWGEKGNGLFGSSIFLGRDTFGNDTGEALPRPRLAATLCRVGLVDSWSGVGMGGTRG
jgi:hypothetical protein